MTGTDSRGAVAAARRLFFEHGYKGVTVRDIAAAAGGSPLVIKHHGSKAELFNDVGPHDLPLAELELPRSAIGRALVRKVIARREHGAPEGWLATTAHVRESPDPERSRAEVRAKLLDSVGALLGDTTPDAATPAPSPAKCSVSPRASASWACSRRRRHPGRSCWTCTRP
ncbi:TetR/AcrR family transcriptional regulator [Nocardiopsis sp. RV163]|uniref:TetR/AcrR family transcriptional regulator n=1 Tax=Nocardiopsis sp. RV163 TaxID=1661388 RepID=UPI001F1ED34B|nr:TetR/AcrR family transcriptional regulator [Nocardiopsis sp. RV163]